MPVGRLGSKAFPQVMVCDQGILLTDRLSPDHVRATSCMICTAISYRQHPAHAHCNTLWPGSVSQASKAALALLPPSAHGPPSGLLILLSHRSVRAFLAVSSRRVSHVTEGQSQRDPLPYIVLCQAQMRISMGRLLH